MTDMMRAALELVRVGIRVIPLCWPISGACGCGRGHEGRDVGKAPLLGKGWHEIESTAEDVRAWWSDWPDANIGIRLELSSLVVVDTDSPEAEAEAHALGLGAPLIARTGRGSHYYYRRGAATARRVTGWGTSGHIDVLGKGFVVAPPSTHASGTAYSWENWPGVGLDLPTWALPLLDPPRPAPRPMPLLDSSSRDWDDAVDALGTLSSDMPHDEWVQILMAIHDLDPGGQGLALAHHWSSTGATYNAAVLDTKWRSFTPGSGVTKATLFGAAIDAGWTAKRNEYTAPPVRAREPDDDGHHGIGEAQEAKPVRIEIEAGNTLYRYGARVDKVVTKANAKGEFSEESTPVARSLYPIARTMDAEDGAHGVVYRYRTHQGQVAEAVCGAEAWCGDRGAASEFAREVAAAGVQLVPTRGALLAQALGEWHLRVTGAPTTTTVQRSGWHADDTVYVNGPSVHGADWVYQGHALRGKSRGTLEEWARGASVIARTPGLLLALGVALSGALIGPLGRSGWLLHLAGASTAGKTRAARLAASVWYNPDHAASWNGTANGIENTLQSFSGACVVLDEIKEARPYHVGEVVHRISDNMGRVRSNRTGSGNLPQRTWALTGISTGEVTVADYMGFGAQGGHLVRAVDLVCERGDCTESAAHADEIDALIRGQYGTAGDAWAAYLVTNPGRMAQVAATADALAADASHMGTDPEARRILRQIALAAACLIEVSRAGVWKANLREGQEIEVLAAKVIEWAMGRIVEERGGATSPEKRGWRTLVQLMESRPACFPQDVDLGQAREVFGVWSAGKMYVTEGMLKDCKPFMEAGVSPRRFIAWCVEDGRAARIEQGRIGGMKARWVSLHVGGDDAEEGPL
jgi:hypothetical protein